MNPDSKGRTLYDSATHRGRIMRQGDVVQMVMDGGGAIAVMTSEFNQAQKWAASKPPTGNLLSDRARFLDQFSSLVSRPNSVQITRGNTMAIERICRTMRGAGIDISEWAIPLEMKDPKYWMPKDIEKKPQAPDEPGEPPA